MKNKSPAHESVPISSSVWYWLITSPSFVIFVLINCALTFAPIMWLFRMSPTRNMSVNSPSRWQMTAYFENRSVCVLCFGRVIFAKTMPTCGDELKKHTWEAESKNKTTQHKLNQLKLTCLMSGWKLVCVHFTCMAYHKSLNHHPVYALKAHYENRFWALFGCPKNGERLLN